MIGVHEINPFPPPTTTTQVPPQAYSMPCQPDKPSQTCQATYFSDDVRNADLVNIGLTATGGKHFTTEEVGGCGGKVTRYLRWDKYASREIFSSMSTCDGATTVREDSESPRQYNKQFNRQCNRQFNRQYNRQFNRQYNRQFNRQFNWQFN